MSNRLTKCNEDGVPKLVQSVEYVRGEYLFKVTLFTGDTIHFEVDAVCQRVPGQTSFPPTNEQFADATVNIEKLVGWGVWDKLTSRQSIAKDIGQTA